MNLEERTRLERLWAKYGVPEREAKMIMRGEVTDTPALLFAKEWLAGTQRPDGASMVVLAGPKGVGKTVAAAYALMHSEPPAPSGYSVWPTDRHARFRHVSEVAELGVWGGKEDKDKRSELKHCKALVVDDVGVEYMSEAFLALWDSLVNARYGSVGFTIFTTNLTHEQFAARYGDRVFDRIRGRGEWFDVDGESMRGGRA